MRGHLLSISSGRTLSAAAPGFPALSVLPRLCPQRSPIRQRSPRLLVSERVAWPRSMDFFWILKNLNKDKNHSLLSSSFTRAALERGCTIPSPSPRPGTASPPGLSEKSDVSCFFQSLSKYVLRSCCFQRRPWQRDEIKGREAGFGNGSIPPNQS